MIQSIGVIYNDRSILLKSDSVHADSVIHLVVVHFSLKINRSVFDLTRFGLLFTWNVTGSLSAFLAVGESIMFVRPIGSIEGDLFDFISVVSFIF